MKRVLLILLFASTLAAAPRRYIVEFTAAAPSARPASARRLRSDAAGAVVVHYEFSHVLHGTAVELRDGQSIDTVSRLPYVAAVYPDSEVIALSDTALPHSMAASLSMARPVSHGNGSGIVVAVIDTGIDATHPALAGKVIGGYDFANDDNDPTDDHGHGTHVAGIIAAQGPGVTGVAPGVHLLAYKVLNAQGRGVTSAVIAGLDRALDPNGDGDTSDHAAIANLSLGDRGNPSDPLAQAVDNAVAAGMIVCAAAGNDGTYHRIGSPASAARAITVGASTVEDGVPIVAYFTSRGPAPGSGAIKPDVLAPGADIYSTGLNHGYMTLSGTSMASPYVAGLAAVLLEEHPGWTPERVKTALVTTARALADEEVMTQGGGVADLVRARANALVATPAQVNLGLNGVTAASWSSTRHFTLHNEDSTPRPVHATVDGASPAMTVRVNPAEATLAPGQTIDYEVTIDVDNTALGKPRTTSFAFGGALVLESNGQEVRLPWAFVRAGRATLTSEDGIADFWLSNTVSQRVSVVSIGAPGVELLIEPGTYDIAVATVHADDLRLVIAEQKPVTGDVAMNITAADAPYEIRVAGTDDRGVPFPDGDGLTTLRSLLLRIVLPGGRTAALPDIAGRVVHTSSFSARFGLLANEAFVDANTSRIYVTQYPLVRDVSASRVLHVSPGEYAAQEVALHFPATSGGDIRIVPRDWPRRPGEYRLLPPVLRFHVEAPVWNETLFLTKEVYGDVAGGVQFTLYPTSNPDDSETLITPTIRRDDGGFLATWGYDESVLPVRAVDGEVMSFGHGAIHFPNPLVATEDAIFSQAEVRGNRGGFRRAEASAARVRVLDSSGTEVWAGAVMPTSLYAPLPHAGSFTAEVRFPTFAFDDRIGEALLTTRFDTSLGVVSAPSVTSLAILDSAGRQATRLPVNGSGSLLFSAAGSEAGIYRRIALGATKVFFRRRNTIPWVELTPAVATGDEETQDLTDPLPSGIVYRVDLRDALRAGPGEYEIAIAIADEHGNSTNWQFGPAFIAEAIPAGKRRAVGR